jgi:hypothetical protein
MGNDLWNPAHSPAADSRWQWTQYRLKAVAAGFPLISLRDMDAAALLDRVDTKFVLPVDKMLWVVAGLQAHYRILSVQGNRLSRYRTLYFDTPNFELFTLHVNGRAERYKVRSREYLETRDVFLEVKHRTVKDRTVKSRIPTAGTAVWMSGDVRRWLRAVYPFEVGTLEPKMWNTFTRITLVNREFTERVTVDTNLTFAKADAQIRLDGIAVVEMKADGRNTASPFMSAMRAERMQPQSFSKYCIGVSLLYHNVKKNRLKAEIMKLEKMGNEVNRG